MPVAIRITTTDQTIDLSLDLSYNNMLLANVITIIVKALKITRRAQSMLRGFTKQQLRIFCPIKPENPNKDQHI